MPVTPPGQLPPLPSCSDMDMGVDPSPGLPLQESDAKRRRVNAITKNHPHADEVVILDDLGLDADVEQSGEVYDDDDAEEHESGDSSIPSELWRACSDGEPTMSVDELAQLVYISAALELDRLVKLGVLEELSWSDDLSNFRTLSTKMVTSWRLKPAPSGEGDAYLRRSRFVARDFRWMNHMMDDEVFAPASSTVLVKVLPAILVSRQLGDEPWEAMSLDVVDAYLTVPQKVPTVVHYGNRVFKLLRNLPGQRTGARDWFEAFQDHLISELSIQPLVEAPALFYIPPKHGPTVNRGGDLSASHGGDVKSGDHGESGGGGLCHVGDMFAIGPKGTAKRVGDCVKSKYKCTMATLTQVGDELSFLKRRHMWCVRDSPEP